MSHFGATTRTAGRSALGLLGLVSALAASCRCAEDPAPKGTSTATLSAFASAFATKPPTKPKPKPYPPPSGPMLAVIAGHGVGPIRFGATVATIERLMESPCEVKTQAVCSYPARGVEFGLVGGAVDSISVHRAGRPAGKNEKGEPIEFGFFRGAIPPDLRLGMLPSAIQEHLKQAERVETVPQPNPTNTVERHYYPGLVIEYDRHDNGKLIMGGIKVLKVPSLPLPQ